MAYITKKDAFILIEPVGIETTSQTTETSPQGILIEPVGIETFLKILIIVSPQNFNRTSWNWNSLPISIQ